MSPAGPRRPRLTITTTSPPPAAIPVLGSLKNFNTIEDFKAADKAALFNAEAQKVWSFYISTSYISLIPQIWDHILASRDTSSLNRFLIIAFADLKKYKYYYWFAFPAFAAKPAWEIDDPLGWKSATDTFTTEQVRMTKPLMDTPHLTHFSSP